MFENPLHPNVLKIAYSHGFFPMPHPETGQIHWFNPDPRAVIPLDGMRISRSFRKFIRTHRFQVSFDMDFQGVMRGCADRPDTWINAEFYRAYSKLHEIGMAHSVEIWKDTDLVGGVYGVSIGRAFFAESMFHRATNASKLALYFLVERLNEFGYELLEVQFMTPHLKSLGAIEIASEVYLNRLKGTVIAEPLRQDWQKIKSPG